MTQAVIEYVSGVCRADTTDDIVEVGISGLGGQGKFDDRWEAIAKQSFHNYESKLEFTYLTDLTSFPTAKRTPKPSGKKTRKGSPR